MRIALVGMPNCGKTSLFNALTGAAQKVGNYPGVTVERKEGWLSGGPDRKKVSVLDLPGIYSLNPRTPDEQVTRDVIFGGHSTEKKPDLLAVILDASRLQQNLRLLLEVRSLGIPCVAVLNMSDVAEKSGLRIDVSRLSAELGMPIFPTVATSQTGIKELRQSLTQFTSSKSVVPVSSNHASLSDHKDLYQQVDEILGRTVQTQTVNQTTPQMWTDRIDRWILHPAWGVLLLFTVLILVFQAVFNWAQLPQDLIRSGVSAVGHFLNQNLPAGPLKSLLVDGIVAGVGAVLVFLPQILLLFLFLLFLEDSGYMARAALLMDRLMGKVGLHGRAFIPLLSSFACAIPGIMSTRTIENPRDRLTTILIAPLMTCSARLPVYALLIGAFIPNIEVLGPFRLQGLVLVALYIAGIVIALMMAWIFRKTVLSGPSPIFLMELPLYRWPSPRSIALGLWERARLFVRRAGTVILTLSVLIWFLVSYPKPSVDELSLGQPAVYSSFAGKVGRTLEPLVRPLGFNWQIVAALIPGFVAREVMVGALATVYAVQAREHIDSKADTANSGGDLESLQFILWSEWSLPTALSVMVWYVLACQCVSTLAVTRRETNSWRWPAVMLGYMTALAYLGSFLVYQLASRFFG